MFSLWYLMFCQTKSFGMFLTRDIPITICKYVILENQHYILLNCSAKDFICLCRKM